MLPFGGPTPYPDTPRRPMLRALLLAALCASAAAAQTLPDTLDGAPRLDGVVMPDLVTRSAFSFDGVAGRLVLVDVWATWCGPCIAEIPTFNALHAALAARTDVAFVSVLDDARAGGMLPQDAEAFVAEHGVRYPALYDLGDDGLGAALGVWAYPSKFLVYPDGSVRAVPLDMDWQVALRLATDALGLLPVGAD